MLTREIDSSDLDFSCEGMRPTETRTGRLARASEKTFLVRLARGKVIGKAHTADLAKARAAEVGGTWEEVAA
jgi:hypothetical protein